MSEANATSSLNEFRSLVTNLQQKRAANLNEVATIDRELLDLKKQLDGLVSQSLPAPKRGRPTGSKNGVARSPRTRTVAKSPNDRSRGRNGGLSGTQKIEAILAGTEGKQMSSGDLAREATKQGVPHPHSSFQSLKRRGRIDMKDGVISLV